MASKYDWEALRDDATGKHAKKRKKGTKREKPYSRKAKSSSHGQARHYKAGYNATPLEKLLATRGEGNASTLALQRGKTVVKKKKKDDERAQSITSKTFDGINILDNFINYDKNVIKEPDMPGIASQFGNFQAASVPHGNVHQPKGLLTRRPCPF